MLLRIEVTKKIMKTMLPKVLVNFVAWFAFNVIISFWLFIGHSFTINIFTLFSISFVWLLWGIYFTLHLLLQSDYAIEFDDNAVKRIVKNKAESFKYNEIDNARYVPVRRIMFLRKKTGFFSLIHTLGFEVPSDRLGEVINILKSKNVLVSEQGLTQYSSKKL